MVCGHQDAKHDSVDVVHTRQVRRASNINVYLLRTLKSMEYRHDIPHIKNRNAQVSSLAIDDITRYVCLSGVKMSVFWKRITAQSRLLIPSRKRVKCIGSTIKAR